MLTLAQTLSYYKRKDVQKLILEQASDKEIGTRFADDNFGKRPDVLNYENDILESAKKGVSSFHCSEELWTNPLQLNSEMRRVDLDKLRKGWDLILDIDCPYWTFSKLTAYVFIKALKDHGIENVTVKFSGSKGFHIAVPFETFPDKSYYIEGKYFSVKELFPEGPRKIAQYLLHYINTQLIKVNDISIIFGKITVPFDRLLSETGKKREELTRTICGKCGNKRNVKNKEEKFEYICPNCENRLEDTDKQYVLCPKCKKIMHKKSLNKSLCQCGSDQVISEFDLSSIVAVDTVLISSRHLYRMPYSLHEKTGFVSVPFDIKHILKFEKTEAHPTRFKPYKFLDRKSCKIGEAELLFQKTFDFTSETEKKTKDNVKKIFEKEKKERTFQNVDIEQKAVPEEFFPPCIKKISQGLEDGKKRALFILINFLSSCNWEHDKMEEYILKWNEKNKPDKLRDTYLKGQLRYYKTQKEKIAPPNCDNRGYMVDTQFCNPDGLCKYIKNPVQYAKKKAWMTANDSDKRKTKKIKTEDKKIST